MIRRSTLLWASLATAAAVLLFQVSYQAEELETALGSIRQEIQAEKYQIRVLKAEWSYVNQPDRLRSLVSRHLPLDASRATQIAHLANIPQRQDGSAIGIDEESYGSQMVVADTSAYPSRKPYQALLLAYGFEKSNPSYGHSDLAAESKNFNAAVQLASIEPSLTMSSDPMLSRSDTHGNGSGDISERQVVNSRFMDLLNRLQTNG